MSNSSLYAHGALKIGEEWIYLGEKRWQTRGILSVHCLSEKPSRWGPILTAVIGVLSYHIFYFLPVLGAIIWAALQKPRYRVLCDTLQGRFAIYEGSSAEDSSEIVAGVRRVLFRQEQNEALSEQKEKKTRAALKN